MSNHVVYADRASLAKVVGSPVGQDERLDIALVMASRWVDRVVGESPVIASVDAVVALYNYGTTGDPTPAPAVGGILHGTKDPTVLHVHRQDAMDGSDHSEAFGIIVAGDRIWSASTDWEVTAPPVFVGDDVQFAITPPVTYTLGDPEQFHFTHYLSGGPQPVQPRPIEPPVFLTTVAVDVGIRQATLVAAARFLRSPDVPFGVAGGLGDLAVRIYADIPEAELHLLGLRRSWGVA